MDDCVLQAIALWPNHDVIKVGLCNNKKLKGSIYQHNRKGELVMKNKLFITALAASVAVPAFVAPISIEASSLEFKDVPTNYYAHKEITNLVERGVIKGFGDGTFLPTKQVTRAEFATFVARSLNLPAADSNFKDVGKSSALYDGVSRAHKAGIIRGFGDGTFKPNVAVNRQDMAVMLDRAMQLKGSYTKTKALDFSDTSKVGAYAKTSVERLYNYNVMGPFSGNNFEATTIGTRAETARAIYNMLTVVEGGTITNPTPPPVTNKSYKDMSIAELKATYPQHHHVIAYREWKPEMKIVELDMMELYHKQINTPASQGGLKNYADAWNPDKWFDSYYPGYMSGYSGAYMDYPMREVISYNGKSYKDSPFMAKNFSITSPSVYATMPSQPKGAGQFLIDIHRYDDDFVVYRHEDIKWDLLGKVPVEKKRGNYPIGSEFVVDIHSALKYATGVTMAQGGLQIAYGGKKIILTNGSSKALIDGLPVTLGETVKVENGRAYGPIREIVSHIGLYTRVSHHHKRFEIANYPLDMTPPGAWLQ